MISNMKIGVEIEAIYNPLKVGTLRTGSHGSGTGSNAVSFKKAKEVTQTVELPEYRVMSSPLGENVIRVAPTFTTSEEHHQPEEDCSWFVERDGSLETDSIDDGFHGHSAEFISKAIVGKDNFLKVLKEFKDLICGDKSYELNEVLSFNDSCGCHIHFSFPDFDINMKCGLTPLTRARRYFFRNLAELKIDNKIKERIKNHYFRQYSRKNDSNRWKNNDGTYYPEGRYMEFNFESIDVNKGFEWRSFNLLGVTKWEDFFTLMMLGHDTCAMLREYLKKFRDSYIGDFKESVDTIIKKVKYEEEKKLNIHGETSTETVVRNTFRDYEQESEFSRDARSLLSIWENRFSVDE